MLKPTRTVIACLLLTSLCVSADFDARRQVVGLMEKAGMQNLLRAPVQVRVVPGRPVQFTDDGVFLVQHTILAAEDAPEPNVILHNADLIPASADKLVIVTHGWLDKGQDRWPNEMADAFCSRTDPNEWLCGWFDWKGGSAVISSVQAAEYARDVAGPRLAAAVIKLNRSWKHIHLVGHSAGSWTIQSAAERLARTFPTTVFHLTFLDAYVPARWDPDCLGRVYCDSARQGTLCWAEHYYTRDFTMKVTEHNLKWAHNVDITALDPFICEHEFPYRWYKATITGCYDRWDERKLLVHSLYGSTDYGFSRSLESSAHNWSRSRALPLNNPVVVFSRPVR
jgi:pimeloyl-ACP methyl ester carboxylesterase